MIYYTCNALFVSTVIALATRQKLLPLYGSSFRLVQWVHFITLPLGGVLAALWKIDPWLIVPGIVPLIMAQRSFKALGAWQAESRRSKALADESQQLASKLERLQDTATAMIASLEPLPLLETVSTRLALLLDASASWVVLLDRAGSAAGGGARHTQPTLAGCRTLRCRAGAQGRASARCQRSGPLR